MSKREKKPDSPLIQQLKADSKPFYRANFYHNCRFCKTPIRKMNHGMLVPLGNFAHFEIPLKGGGKFTLNCCADCAERIQPDDYQDICKHDPNMKRYLDKGEMYECKQEKGSRRKLNELLDPSN